MSDNTSFEGLTLTIPYPSYIPRARGIHAVGKFGSLLKAKCSVAERQLVIEAAAKANISVAEFIRWCAVQCAKEITNVQQAPEL